MIGVAPEDLGAGFLECIEFDKVCVRDDQSGWLTGAVLNDATHKLARRLSEVGPGLIFLFARNDTTTLIGLLAAWSSRLAVALLDPTLPSDSIRNLLTSYQPEILLGGDDLTNRYLSYERVSPHGVNLAPTIHFCRIGGRGNLNPDLALLLSTSGSTGSPKFVRLSRTAVATNARQIAEALAINADDIGIGHLPIHYSYGLSVVTSHLIAGAAISLTQARVTDQILWQRIREDAATHFPGVPFHYEVLDRLKIRRTVPESVRTFTQAGGHLKHQLRLRCYDAISERGGRFYIMYGQTEAGPRISTLQSEDFPSHSESVGRALKGGKLSIVNTHGEVQAPGEEGSVVYEGPNVMMGYASSRNDLSLPDVQKGRLETGDRGIMSEDGYLTVVGRTQRFAKIAGLRISLDDIESHFGLSDAVVALAPDDKILLFTNKSAASTVTDLIPKLAHRLNLPSRVFITMVIDTIPRTVSGKIDYKALERLQ